MSSLLSQLDVQNFCRQPSTRSGTASESKSDELSRSFRQRRTSMNFSKLWNETKKYSVVRGDTWQGQSARGGPQHDVSALSTSASSPSASAQADQKSSHSNPGTNSMLWDRLAAATGSASHGAAVVRLMQKHLLETVEKMPLDEIELMSRQP